MKRIYSVLVENRSGVLCKVAGLFSRRCFNIDSLAVGETDDPDVSCMTIVSSGDNRTIEQIEKQLSKLVEVISIKHCETSETVLRELALIKVAVSGERRGVVIETANIFRAHIVDVGIDSLVIEATGSEDKIASLIRLLEPFGIMELVRTGLTAMERGAELLGSD